jgi:hypothetical protein
LALSGIKHQIKQFNVNAANKGIMRGLWRNYGDSSGDCSVFRESHAQRRIIGFASKLFKAGERQTASTAQKMNYLLILPGLQIAAFLIVIHLEIGTDS